MTAGYTVQTAYVSEYHPDHTPTIMNMAAVMNGFPARNLNDAFTWADFGCADGLTACALAAAYPQGQFYGIDFAADAIDRAKALAAETDLDNTTFLAKGFADLTDDDLPPLDFAVVYGVLSWVDDATRSALLGYIARRLKPGGMLLVGYDSLPGWAQLLPMRTRMLAETTHLAGSPTERAVAAVDWLDRQVAASPKFFRDNKLAEEWVVDLKRRDPSYIAHEFFNDILRPFQASDMIGTMASLGANLGLSFAGSTTVFLNMLDLAVPSALHDEFAAVPDRAAFEDKRDFLRNETFRRDVYVKGGAFTELAAWERAWADMVVGTVEPLAAIDRSVPFGDVVLNYDGAPFDDCLSALAGAAMPVAALPCPDDQKRDAAQLLMAGGQVLPFANAAQKVSGDEAHRYTMPLAFNRRAITLQRAGHHMVALASPVLGGAIQLPNIDVLLLLGLCEAGWDGAAAWALEQLPSGSLVDQGQRLEGADATAFMDKAFEALKPLIPKLIELGILQVV